MILKIVKIRQEQGIEENCLKIITEFYEDKWFRLCDGFIKNSKESIDISKYSLLDEITNKWCDYETTEAYLMNNEGKTIERLK